MRDKLGILFVLVMCFACQTAADQKAEKEIADEATYKAAIAAQSSLLINP